MEREGIPPSDTDRPSAAHRVVQEEEERTSALIPTLPPVMSPPPSLPELDSEIPRSIREAPQDENVLVPSDGSSHLDSDRSHRTTSQNSRNQIWSMPPDVLSREMRENVQNVRALEPVHPVNHQEPNLQRQPSKDLTPELMIWGTGCLPRLRKMRKTCGPRQILKCCGSSKSTITSGRTMGNPPVCVKKSGVSSSAINVKTSRHMSVSVDPNSLA